MLVIIEYSISKPHFIHFNFESVHSSYLFLSLATDHRHQITLTIKLRILDSEIIYFQLELFIKHYIVLIIIQTQKREVPQL